MRDRRCSRFDDSTGSARLGPTCTAGIVALSAGLTGCPIDDRTLDPIAPIYSDAGVDAALGTGGLDGGGEGGFGDTPSAGEAGTTATGSDGGGPSAAGGSSATAGSSATGGSAATAGSSTAGGAGVDCGCGPLHCPDLDQNGVPDCDESMALNPSFDSDARGWALETGVHVSWVGDDAHDNAASGSLGLLNTAEDDRDGGSLLGARQCLTVKGGLPYRFAVEVAVPPEAETTYGGFQLFVYDGPACSGSVLDDQTSIMLEDAAWTVTDITYLTPTGARSVSMRLVALKAFRSPPAQVLFDNVLVRIDG